MHPTLLAVLGEALDDEYKARATYEEIIRTYGPVRPFSRIVEAEDRHVHALLRLYEKYGLPIPPDPWRGNIPVPDTLADACRAAVQAEIDNAAMYRRLLAASRNYPDVQAVLGNLQRASRDNHLPAFQRALLRLVPEQSSTFNAGRFAEPIQDSPTSPWQTPVGRPMENQTGLGCQGGHRGEHARGRGCHGGGRGWQRHAT